MTAYDVAPLSMKSLDGLQVELIVLPFFADERPLRGAAGLIDWRLCGTLSRKLMAGYLDGHFGETGIVVAPPKIRSEGLLLFGLGPSGSFAPRAAEKACAEIARWLDQAKTSTAALSLPGRSFGLLPALDAMQLWLSAVPKELSLDEISILEPAEEHRALAALFDGLRRQAESPLG